MTAIPRLLVAVLALSLSACKGGEELTVEEADVRVSGLDDVDARSLRGCVDELGGVHLVWTDDRDGVDTIWHAASADGGASWTEQRVSDDGPASEPDVACVGERVYVVWEDLRDSDVDLGNVYLDRSLDAGATWGEDLPLDDDPFGEDMSRGPRIAAEGSSVHVVWYDGRSGAFDVYIQSSTDGGDIWLNDAVRVDTDEAGAAWSGAPQIAADGLGSVVVVWEELRDGVPSVHANASTDFGRSFGPADVALDDGAGISDPILARDGDRVLVAWHEDTEGGRVVRGAASGDGGEFWAPAQDLSPTGVDAFRPALAGAGGVIHAAWQDDRVGFHDVFHRSYAGGGDWGDEHRLDMDWEGSGLSLEVALAAWDDELVVAAWEDRRDDGNGLGFNDLYYNWSEDGGLTWSEVDMRINGDAPGGGWSQEPWISRSPDGDVLYFAWLDGRYGSADVYFNALDVGAESEWDPPAP